MSDKNRQKLNMETEQICDIMEPDFMKSVMQAFSTLTGMGAAIIDLEGNYIIEPQDYNVFCSKYIRQSEIGCLYCTQSECYGALKSLERGSTEVYTCHAGLAVAAAPISFNGKILGSLIGEGVAYEKLSQKQLVLLAKELNIDEESLVSASRTIKIMSEDDVNRAAGFLNELSQIMSEMAYSTAVAKRANSEIERAASMKSEFLANMSHEIRTPMNAVIGMAEMALREKLDEKEKEYISQIKNSGKVLLNIINDILDFSKIDSGKMELIEVSYDLPGLISDITGIVSSRVLDKDIEVIVDMDPAMPRVLFGDDLHIKQILLKICDNAVKFTEKGQIKLSFNQIPVNEEQLLLCMSVRDTGMGIKDSDLKQLFESFAQLDSKRNRNVEGTGLGLAISKQLVTLMKGDLEVESKYGEGTVFFIQIPQKITDSSMVAEISPEQVKEKLIWFSKNEYLTQQFLKDAYALGVEADSIYIEDELAESEDVPAILFVTEDVYSEGLRNIIAGRKNLSVYVLCDKASQLEGIKEKGAVPVLKPMGCVALAKIVKGEYIFDAREDENDGFDFIAPMARILIVDDNAINITVAEGLLEPLKMQIDKALSGAEALELLTSKEKYDIVFMDQMMPEMDGIETSCIIRRDMPDYADVPIVVLTANSPAEARRMFEERGAEEAADDYLSKPIELKGLVRVLRHYLPFEKLQKCADNNALNEKTASDGLVIGNLDTTYAIKLLGTEKLYMTVLKDYYKAIERKAAVIEEHESAGDIKAYTIEVHALKSASKQIGAMELSELAAALEKAGQEENITLIKEKTAELISIYRGYIPVLEELFDTRSDNKQEKQIATKETLLWSINELMDAFEELDMDEMERICEELLSYSYNEKIAPLIRELTEVVGMMDIETGEELIAKIKEQVIVE